MPIVKALFISILKSHRPKCVCLFPTSPNMWNASAKTCITPNKSTRTFPSQYTPTYTSYTARFFTAFQQEISCISMRIYIYINNIYRYKCLLYLYNCYYMLLYHISTPRNISNAASQHLLSKLKFLLKPLMLYLYKKHLVNFIIISFTIQTSTQTSYTPEKWTTGT